MLKNGTSSLSDELLKKFKENGAVLVIGREPSETATTIKNFKNLRIAADDFHRRRAEFMTANLSEQRHPDTDPGFWSGFVEPKRPELLEPAIWVRWFDQHNPNFLAIGTLLVLAVVVPAYAISLMRKRCKRGSGTA